MKIIECKAKLGKRKRNLIFFLVSDEDVASLDSKSLHGTFERGQVVLSHAKNEDEIMKMIKEME